jgi:hypothetical protein
VRTRLWGCSMEPLETLRCQIGDVAMWGPRNGTPKNPAVLVQLDPEQYEMVATLAGREDRSMASWVRHHVLRALLEAEAA